jgi:hypothetical protein
MRSEIKKEKKVKGSSKIPNEVIGSGKIAKK